MLCTYTPPLHSVPPLHPYTLYLHSIPTLHPYTLYLHSIPTLHPYTPSLHSTPTLCTYTPCLLQQVSSSKREIATLTASYELQLGELKSKIHDLSMQLNNKVSGQFLQPSSSGLCLVLHSEGSDENKKVTRKSRRNKRLDEAQYHDVVVCCVL